MGLLREQDWKAAWIAASAKRGASSPVGNAAVLLRKPLAIGKPVARATVSICGLGYCELFINGRKIGDHRLDPGFTDFSKRVLYATYDVADAVRQGENAVGVMLGGGWYDLPAPDLFGNQKAPWSASPRLLFRLRIELADGSVQTLVSDSSWKWSTGEIVFQSVRGGETRDMRLAKPGWNAPGYDDRDWQAATIVPGPAGKLRSQQHPAIKTDGEITCLGVSEPKPGIYVFKLAENTAGWPRLTVAGAAGQKITLRANEGLKPGRHAVRPVALAHRRPLSNRRIHPQGPGTRSARAAVVLPRLPVRAGRGPPRQARARPTWSAFASTRDRTRQASSLAPTSG